MTPLERAWRGTKNDWRLHVLSIFSVAVAFVCLAAALLVVVNVKAIQSRWVESGRASVYLLPEATPDQTRAIEAALRASAGVTDVRYVSSEDARRELTGNGDNDVLAALPAAAFPASLEVRVQDDAEGSRLNKLSALLGSLPAVEAVETYQDWGKRLGGLLAGGVSAALVLALVVLAAVVSVVSSTIRLSLQRRRIEVEVLKLVGATDSYVRRPFVVEGAAQGAIGAFFAVMLLGLLYGIVKNHFDGQLAILLGVTPTFLPWTVVLSMVILGGGLGALAAFTSLRKLLIV
ncbi:MAG: permease-like cell division protein FtsX [Polyangiaceae bacterium]|nr:permease-like cell division protein FtsX [Polyangiaceae bacterium]